MSGDNASQLREQYSCPCLDAIQTLSNLYCGSCGYSELATVHIWVRLVICQGMIWASGARYNCNQVQERGLYWIVCSPQHETSMEIIQSSNRINYARTKYRDYMNMPTSHEGFLGIVNVWMVRGDILTPKTLDLYCTTTKLRWVSMITCSDWNLKVIYDQFTCVSWYSPCAF